MGGSQSTHGNLRHREELDASDPMIQRYNDIARLCRTSLGRWEITLVGDERRWRSSRLERGVVEPHLHFGGLRYRADGCRERKEADARREAFITMKCELDRRVFWSAIPFNQIDADVRDP
jgi:hypothetical protein